MMTMRTRLLVLLLLLAPTTAMAQNAGSWEFGVSAGALYNDGHLVGVMHNNGFLNASQRLIPTFGGRLGANVSDHVGISVGAMWSSQMWWTWNGTLGGIKTGTRYLAPFVNATWTPWRSGFSPFVMGGAQFSRVTSPWGDQAGRVRHTVWGTNAGGGFRIMMGDHAALRLAAQVAVEHYDWPTQLYGRRTMYSPSATIGWSYFTRGYRKHTDTVTHWMPAPSTRIRVDTLWRERIVLKDTLVLEGVTFAFDSSVLTPDTKSILDGVAVQMVDAKWKEMRWEVAGYASVPGESAYNQALSERRAQAVRAYLISHGVPADRLSVHGYGEESPKFLGDWRNQRVALLRNH